MDKMGWWGIDEQITFQNGVEDLILIGNYSVTVGVPSDSTEDFKKKVLAAAISVPLGIKSIDYTLEKYVSDNSFEIDKNQRIINDMVKDIKRLIVDSLDYLMSIPNKPDNPNLYFSGAALIRMQNTFKASLICIKSNLHFESLGMQRMILEQLAWIYKLHDHEDFFVDVKVKKSISYLKNLIPDAGKLYSYLSNGVHLSPNLVTEYVNKDLSIKIGDIKQSLLDGLILCKLADYFCVVGEYIYANFGLIDKCRYLMIKNGKLKMKPDRESKKLFLKYREKLKVVVFNES